MKTIHTTRHISPSSLGDSMSLQPIATKGKSFTFLRVIRCAVLFCLGGVCALTNLTAQTNLTITNLTIQEIYSFPTNGNYGKTPNTLVQGSNGNLYGTTVGGSGTNTNGTVFRLSLGPPVTVTTIAVFTGTSGTFPGKSPEAGLVQGSNGLFYGTTSAGGTSNLGTVFSITTNGSTNLLASFTGTNGSHPLAPLVQGSDGNFYGTTSTGGTNGSTNGTVFRLTLGPPASITNLATFTGTNGALAGATPSAGLVQGTDGYFYGTALNGGTYRRGTVFKISASGSTSNLLSFTPTNSTATNPVGGLIQASDGNFYGTTASPIYATPGSVFRMTSNGVPTTIFVFSNTVAGKPNPGLIQGSDGYLYGTTPDGGSNGLGTVFQMTTNGTIIGLGNFYNTNGEQPATGLIQASDGNFYGTTTKDTTSVNQHAGDVAFDVRQQIATGQVLPQVAGSALCARTVLSQVDDCFAVVENRYDGSDDGGEFDRPAQDPYIPPSVRECSVIAGKRPYVVCQVLRCDAVQPLRVVKVRGSPRSGAQQVACEASISAA